MLPVCTCNSSIHTPKGRGSLTVCRECIWVVLRGYSALQISSNVTLMRRHFVRYRTGSVFFVFRLYRVVLCKALSWRWPPSSGKLLNISGCDVKHAEGSCVDVSQGASGKLEGCNLSGSQAGVSRVDEGAQVEATDCRINYITRALRISGRKRS